MKIRFLFCRSVGGLTLPESRLFRVLPQCSLTVLVPEPRSANTAPRFALHRHRGMICRANNPGNYLSQLASSSSGQGKGCGTALPARIKFKNRIICRFLLCLSSLRRPCRALLNKHLCEMGAWSSHDICSLIGRTSGLICSTERRGFILFIKSKYDLRVSSSADVLQCRTVSDPVEKF